MADVKELINYFKRFRSASPSVQSGVNVKEAVSMAKQAFPQYSQQIQQATAPYMPTQPAATKRNTIDDLTGIAPRGYAPETKTQPGIGVGYYPMTPRDPAYNPYREWQSNPQGFRYDYQRAGVPSVVDTTGISPAPWQPGWGYARNNYNANNNAYVPLIPRNTNGNR